MRIVKPVLVLFLMLALIFTLAACKGDEAFDSGTPLTPGDVNNLKNDLEQKGEQEQGGGDEEPETPKAPESTQPQEPVFTTVYWLPKGSVYHSDENCYHIRGKDNVESGTVEAAAEAGKERLCSACAD